MKRKAFFWLLTFFMFSAIKIAAASTSSIMVNAEDGKVIYELNADELRYPASLTKLMTLYITFNALEHGHISLDDELKVSYTAASRSPSRLGVAPGETITVKDAIMAVIVKSANDCATVLAERFASNEAEFADLMTKTAHKMGMTGTTFKNASGLPHTKQKTTARDMAILALAIYHHFPQYYKWFSYNSFEYGGKKITGHNYILKSFEGADGMKTGYTAASGYNIVTSAKRGDKRVIAVTMGHKYLSERDKKVSLMMDLGLEELKRTPEINVAALSEKINTATPAENEPANTPAATRSIKVAKVVKNTAEKNKSSGGIFGQYAIQVGSFSDYNRAKDYAQSIKNKLAKKYGTYQAKVEKVNVQNGVMYRSKVVGMGKSAAQDICSGLKKQNKSCLVIRDNSSVNLALK
ncbi:MAG: D-alanyl-D-alanine carboxypeptidase [Alphaproteobacteria bacterium]|nr:D-alanyl-D-alanine carboxypeptidase [Alphaproteobacteria bacterium]